MKLLLAAMLTTCTLSPQTPRISNNSTLATPKGPIEIQLLDATTEERPYTSYHELKMEGLVVNKTNFALGRTAIHPVYTLKDGTVRKGGGLSVITVLALASGEAKKFKISDPVSEFGFGEVASLAWEGSVNAAIEYDFRQPIVLKEVSGTKATARVGLKCIAIEVENNSDSPVEIVWDDSSFIGLTRKAGRVFHVGVKYNDREKSQPNTVIPPLAKIEDEVTPSENAYFVEGSRYSTASWTVAPILPREVPAEKLDVVAGIPGGRVGLFLQLLISGKKVPLTFMFEVEKATSGNEVWNATTR